MKKLFLAMATCTTILCSCNNSTESTNSECNNAAENPLKVAYSETTINDKEGKSVLIVSASPRKGGNTDLLADEFAKGATEAGGKVEKVFLADYDLKFLSEEGAENPKESMRETDNWKLTEKFLAADVVVLASPVYYMNVTDRMKTFIDGTFLAYGDERMGGKEYYYLTACADNEEFTAECVFQGLRGFVYCLPNSTERGYVGSIGIGRKGAVVGTKYMQEAYELGKTINKK